MCKVRGATQPLLLTLKLHSLIVLFLQVVLNQLAWPSWGDGWVQVQQGGSPQAKEGSTENLLCAGVSLMPGASESRATLLPGHNGQQGARRP